MEVFRCLSESFKWFVILYYLNIFLNLTSCFTNDTFNPNFNDTLSITFNVALLMVRRYYKDSVRFDFVHIGPAIDIAVEKCHYEYNININLINGLYENACNETEAIGKIHDIIEAYRDNPIMAMIGPACSSDLHVVGRLAAYKGIPLLTGLGDVIVGKRSEYSSIIRVSYDMKDKAKAMLSFLSYFNWYTFGVIYRLGDVYYNTLADELIILPKLKTFAKFTCSCEATYIRNSNKTIITSLDKLMDKMSNCARIILILGGDRDVRSMMLVAHRKRMTQGEYLFIYPELFEYEALGNTTWSRQTDNKERLDILKEAFQVLMIITLSQPVGPTFLNFSEEVKYRALRDYNFTYNEKVTNYVTASFHDSVLLLCKAISEATEAKKNPYERYLLVNEMRNSSFKGITGNVTIDESGDRLADYALIKQVNTTTGDFQVVLRYYGAKNYFTEDYPFTWLPAGQKPLDIPLCGFDGKLCSKDDSIWKYVIVSLLCLIAFLVIIAVFVYRKMKLETSLANMTWKVKWEEISLRNLSPAHGIAGAAALTNENFAGQSNTVQNNAPILSGIYKGNMVVIKRLSDKKIELTRNNLLEFKRMQETSHENLARFIGACVEHPVAILNEYCSKGSLRDLLLHSSLTLDWIFRYSLINDIISGMCFLHSSEHIFHGRLRSTNCLVDSRFCVKISDFGLNLLRSMVRNLNDLDTVTSNNLGNSIELNNKHANIFNYEKASHDPYYQLYQSPDLIQLPLMECKCQKPKNYHQRPCNECCHRGQKGDVYSFSIILQEIITRLVPFHPYTEQEPTADIIHRINFENLRPVVPQHACDSELYKLMVRCWSREVDQRPDFNLLKKQIHVLSKSHGNNEDSHEHVTLTEKLLNRMEQYANELESIVEQRTGELAEEKKKSEELLYQILPKFVANMLKRGESVAPDYFESVTIYFSDIVGFTSMCSESTPMQVVDFLNDLYTCFDSIINDFDVYKVETIGDAYMVVSGLPERNGNEHVRQIARMSLKLLDSIEHFEIKHRGGEKIKIRIGLHTGPCCAGVVGHQRPRYCLFGDTVNTASRMESTGEALKIHVSQATKSHLDVYRTFVLEERGTTKVKGKGEMTTYWLIREEKIR